MDPLTIKLVSTDIDGSAVTEGGGGGGGGATLVSNS